jgi:hypothetical protein
MPVISDTVLGIIAAAVPLLIIGFFALRRLPAVFAFFVVLVAVGLGYLQTTGAMSDFGHTVRASLPAGVLPAAETSGEATPTVTPAAEAPAAETPAMAPEQPTPADDTPAMAPAEPEPSTTPPAESTTEPSPDDSSSTTTPAQSEPSTTTPAPATP